jgi:nucleoside-diphosphate-sugar epimerase
MRVSLIRPRTIVGTGRLGIFDILFNRVRDGPNIEVIGSGNNFFQFIHVDDLCEASIRSALQKIPGLFNVGTDRFGTLREDLGALTAQFVPVRCSLHNPVSCINGGAMVLRLEQRV